MTISWRIWRRLDREALVTDSRWCLKAMEVNCKNTFLLVPHRKKLSSTSKSYSFIFWAERRSKKSRGTPPCILSVGKALTNKSIVCTVAFHSVKMLENAFPGLYNLKLFWGLRHQLNSFGRPIQISLQQFGCWYYWSACWPVKQKVRIESWSLNLKFNKAGKLRRMTNKLT